MIDRESPAPAADEAALEATILRLVAERGYGKTICPSEAARAHSGPAGDQWGAMMPAVRRASVRLAKAGRLVISRKGRIVDPDAIKGVYRLGLPSDE
jgi:hypothetical protein